MDAGSRNYLALAAGAACAYHGYRRNRSVLWAAIWAAVGASVPIIAVPVALAQGFGKERRT